MVISKRTFIFDSLRVGLTYSGVGGPTFPGVGGGGSKCLFL